MRIEPLAKAPTPRLAGRENEVGSFGDCEIGRREDADSVAVDAVGEAGCSMTLRRRRRRRSQPAYTYVAL